MAEPGFDWYYLPNSGGTGTGPHMKEGGFFREQGGFEQTWGEKWVGLGVGEYKNHREAFLAARKLNRRAYPEHRDNFI